MYTWYSVINSTDFYLTINGNYSMKVNRLGIGVFMYNRADFSKVFINFDTIMVDFSNVSPTLRDYFLPASYLAQNNSIMYGLLDF